MNLYNNYKQYILYIITYYTNDKKNTNVNFILQY